MIKLKDLLNEIQSKPLTVYHGTDSEFEEFDLNKSTQGIIWFTSNKNKILSNEAGAQGKGFIITAEVTINNPAGWDEYENLGLGQIEDARFDGVILKDTDDQFDCFVFSPKQIKIVKSEKIPERQSSEEDYKGQHLAPDKDGGAPLYDLTKIYPDDVYSSKAAEYYGDRSTDYSDAESVSIIQSARGTPDKQIKIYRAVPNISKKLKGLEINSGDWVTINKRYAIGHGRSTLLGDYKILTKTVPARHLFTTGDSLHEFGYDPS